jgi:hypothetical protein
MAEHDTNAEAARKRQQAEQEEATKKRLAEERQTREKAHAEQRDATTAVKPTPTQEENDLAASGVHVIDKAPDGSLPDQGITPTAAGTTSSTRQVEAKKPAARGDYQTRGAASHHD